MKRSARKYFLTIVMSHKTYLKLTGAIFLVIGLLHGARLLYGWDALIGSWEVPMLASWVALAVGLYLGWQGLTLAKK